MREWRLRPIAQPPQVDAQWSGTTGRESILATLSRRKSPAPAAAMELILQQFATYVALSAELVCILCIAIGAGEAIFLAGRYVFTSPQDVEGARRQVWRRFARWIVLALEFALAADIARTAISPTWDDIGQLAAIAVIRTALNYFLERDLEEFSKPRERRPRRDAAP